ncbi:MAG: NmrA family NAD(P)-binding protein [Cyanobacteria bacterium P01_E01_bin.6]
MKPTILVTSAAGHTGSLVVHQLLAEGFPVRAFVRRHDARSQRLKQMGAEIVAGNLFDMQDLRNALVGVQRAYYCVPFAPNLLHGSMLFALAAEEATLEVIAILTAWNPHPSHPSIHQREHWIANNIHQWLPTVDVIHINPGLFAFPYFLGLLAVAHFGTLMLPFGDGLNAPPSNEDIAAIATGVLTQPEQHLGQTYRPTGPKLVSGYDVADIFSHILKRKVRYRDVSIPMFAKAAKTLGFSNFEIAQMRHYAQEMQQGVYAIGAPTDHVEQVCGRPAENFEVTARRYIRHPELVFPPLTMGSKWNAIQFMLKAMLTSVPDLDRWETNRGYPLLTQATLAHESEEWLTAAQHKQLVLIQPNQAIPADPGIPLSH